MKYSIFFGAVMFLFSCGSSKNITENQLLDKVNMTEDTSILEQPVYRASETILTDLIHTKLEVRFDWEKAYLLGKATLTARPYFYPSNSLILDAKGMDIHSVSSKNRPLIYSYENDIITIELDTVYTKLDTFQVELVYTAKPNERKAGGSQAITSDKGLYFINPNGEDPTTMPQIWTQGETEASSVWFPTIDAPNQKTTQEVLITVQHKYRTLSNGKLISQTQHADGTRTDHWKQELPHAPYLAMMAIGEFKKVSDSVVQKDGKRIEVDYYVEPEWEQFAQSIFGNTPEMITYFSELLGVEFPWDKYAQIVVREFVSGAMENTGAVVFGDFVYKNERELLDENDDAIIAHELFHHWFGDLVTCESWANLPLNESFANYSQYLWDEYKYGQDEADYNAVIEKQGFYRSAQTRGHHDMIWFDYPDKEAMFDGHSYNKGGRILHMLRTYLGDEAFFEGTRIYLQENQYQPTEIHHLRLAFEKASGQDLNWFFNQWFFASRFPELNVEHEIIEQELRITVGQTQNLSLAPLYRLPLKIDVYTTEGKKSVEVEINKSLQTIYIAFEGEILNIVFDAERAMLGTIKHTRPVSYYLHQYTHAPKYLDRLEAIEAVAKKRTTESSQLLLKALDDSFWGIRLAALEKVNFIVPQQRAEFEQKAAELAEKDAKSAVRATAIEVLSAQFLDKNTMLQTTIESALESDSSYKVISSALFALAKYNPDKAMHKADSLRLNANSGLNSAIAYVFYQYGDTSHLSFMYNCLIEKKVTDFEAVSTLGNYTNLLLKQKPAVIRDNLGALEKIQTINSAYISAMFPINLQRMRMQLVKRINAMQLSYEKEMDLKNVAIANQIKKEKEILEFCVVQINKIAN